MLPIKYVHICDHHKHYPNNPNYYTLPTDQKKKKNGPTKRWVFIKVYSSGSKTKM